MNLRLFEFYARYLWPIRRLFVRALPRRCKRCILSTKRTSLDEDGICGECHAVLPRDSISAAPRDMERQFDDTVRSYAGRGNRYDALLLLSGGKDSAFILHKLRSLYPDLRILAVTVDNGFLSPVALANASHTASKLGTDLLVIRSYADAFAKAFREAFLTLQGRGASEVVDYADGSLVFDIGRDTASAMNIPLMIGGLSWVQLERIVGIVDTFEMPEERSPHLIFPLAVWRVDEQEIRSAVRELGLIPPGNDSPLVTNSALVVPMCVVDILNHGYCSFEPEFAQLVREKKTDRRLWLHIFELMEHGVRTGRLVKEANQTLSRLGLTLNEITGAKT